MNTVFLQEITEETEKRSLCYLRFLLFKKESVMHPLQQIGNIKRLAISNHGEPTPTAFHNIAWGRAEASETSFRAAPGTDRAATNGRVNEYPFVRRLPRPHPSARCHLESRCDRRIAGPISASADGPSIGESLARPNHRVTP